MRVLLTLFLYLSWGGFLWAQSFQLSYFEDTENHSFNEVKEQNFRLSEKSEINFGFSPSTFWLKFENFDFGDSEDLLLTSMNAITDSIQAYIISEDGTIIESYYGSQVQNSKEEFVSPMAIPIDSETNEIYLRMWSHTFYRDAFKIRNREDYVREKTNFTIFMGAVLGLLFILFCYNLILYFRLKESAQLYYAVFAFALIFLFSYIEGLGSNYLSGLWNSIFYVVEPISLGLGIFGINFYSKTLFNLPTDHKKGNWYFTILGAIGLSFVLLAFILSPKASSLLSNVFVMISTLSVTGLSIWAMTKKKQFATFFFLGWTIFMIGATWRILFNLGVSDYSILAPIFNYCGVLIEAFVFTWLISNRIRAYQTAQIKNQIELESLTQKLDDLSEQLNQSVQNESGAAVEAKFSDKELDTYLIDPLTERELEIFNCLKDGLTYQQIADQLFISKNTVKTHVLKIYSKLDVSNRTQAINKAGQLNIPQEKA